MTYETIVKPNDLTSLGLLGYVIICNRQVHSYQMDALNDYLSSLGLNSQQTVLDDIIDGKTGAITYNESLSAFAKESLQVKKNILFNMFVLASIDGSVDENEDKLFRDVLFETELDATEAKSLRRNAEQKAKEIRNSTNTLFMPVKPKEQAHKSWLRRLIYAVCGFFKNLFRKKQENLETEKKKGYEEAIKQCTEIAKEDLEFLTPIYSHIYDSCINTLNEIKKCKSDIVHENNYSEETESIIDAFVDSLNRDVVNKCQETKESLDQKKRAASDFTISFLGRTKAGKSTLHAILTNQGKEKIGKGKQRTTRYNRVYQWNKLRIIDTPGIGSGEEDGLRDAEIAMSILGESDIVCFVVVDDSILDDTLKLFEKVAKMNKPIIVLLNHKENIRNKVRFDRFLRNPHDWADTDGEDNLSGYINRIQRYADEKEFGEQIKIYPVFLLAAMMASEKAYADNSILLWESSNIEEFINQLENWVIECGTLKRSQTILDEVVQSFNQSIKSIEDAKADLLNKKKELFLEKTKLVDELREVEKRICDNLNNELNDRFKLLIQEEAWGFAEDIVNNNVADANCWKDFLVRVGFEDDIKDYITNGINQFADEVNNQQLVLFNDLDLSTLESELIIKIPNLFDFKTTTQLAGDVTAIIGEIVVGVLGLTNPLGWGIIAIAGAIGLSSSLFNTKDQKKQEAIKRIYKSVRDHLEENAPMIIDNSIADVRGSIEKEILRIEGLFENVEIVLSNIYNLAKELGMKYETSVASINYQYAYRIVNYIERREESACIAPDDILNVNRIKNEIIIELSGKKESSCTYDLDGIIAESVMINWRDKNEYKE